LLIKTLEAAQKAPDARRGEALSEGVLVVRRSEEADGATQQVDFLGVLLNIH
jgi:hypothetical protein